MVEINGSSVSVVDHQNYSSFGGITSDTNPGYEFRFGYTGRLWDADISLQFNRARWYDARIGKFLSEDPLGFAAGDANLTRYVGNDPVNFVDPTGLQEDDPLLMQLPGLDDPIIQEAEGSPQFQGPTASGAHQPGGFAVVEKLVNKGINWIADKWFGGGKSKAKGTPAQSPSTANGTQIDGSNTPYANSLQFHVDAGPLAVWQTGGSNYNYINMPVSQQFYGGLYESTPIPASNRPLYIPLADGASRLSLSELGSLPPELVLEWDEGKVNEYLRREALGIPQPITVPMWNPNRGLLGGYEEVTLSDPSHIAWYNEIVAANQRIFQAEQRLRLQQEEAARNMGQIYPDYSRMNPQAATALYLENVQLHHGWQAAWFGPGGYFEHLITMFGAGLGRPGALRAFQGGNYAPRPSAGNTFNYYVGIQNAQAIVSAPRTASGAESAAQYATLKEFYRQAETYGSGGIRQLENSRYRLYGDLRTPRTPGEVIGQRTVREWNPANGNTRTWLETLDQSGRVRIVRPETGGPKIHFLFDAEGNYVGTF